MKLYEISTAATTARAVIFTAGHYVIDVTTVLMLTEATFREASQVGVVAPLLNGVWFWLLDRAWTHWHNLREDRLRLEGQFGSQTSS